MSTIYDSQKMWERIYNQFEFDKETNCPVLDNYTPNEFNDICTNIGVPMGTRLELGFANVLRLSDIEGLKYTGGTAEDYIDGSDATIFDVIRADITYYKDWKLSTSKDPYLSVIFEGHKCDILVRIRNRVHGPTFPYPVLVLCLDCKRTDEFEAKFSAVRSAGYALLNLLKNPGFISKSGVNPVKDYYDALRMCKGTPAITKARKAYNNWAYYLPNCVPFSM